MRAQSPISIVVPLYRPDPTLWADCAAALGSFADESDAEIVLSLEPGADAHNEVARTIEDLRQRCGFLVLAHNEQRLGMVANWNEAVRRSTREWVMLIGQDDIIDRRGIARTLDLAREADAARLVGHRRVLVRDGRVHKQIPSRFRRVVDRNTVLPPAKLELSADLVVYLALRNGNVFGEPCSVIFKRSLFDELAGYSKQFVHAADLDFTIRAALHDDRIVLCPHSIAERHVHPGSLTNVNLADGAAAQDRSSLYSKYLSILGLRLRSRARGAHAVFVFYDAVLAFRNRRIRRSLRLAGRATRLAARSPGATGLRCKELIRGTNDDRRMLEMDRVAS